MSVYEFCLHCLFALEFDLGGEVVLVMVGLLGVEGSSIR